jgi:drug/metabolite transporter (DMT)-like permease
LVSGAALGATAVASRIGVMEMPALAFVALRLAVAVVLFLPALWILGLRLPRDFSTWRDVGVVAITTTAPLIAFTYALYWISAGVLTVFLALIPMFTGILAHRILAHEKLTSAKLAGLATAFGGVTVILATRTSGLTGVAEAGVSTGHALALAGSVVAAYSGVHVRRTLVAVPAPVVTAGQTALSLMLVVPLALALGGPSLVRFSALAWAAVVFTAALGSFFASWALTRVAQQHGATASAQAVYVMPLVSSTMGAAMLGEQLGPALLLGGVLILLGLYLANR